MAYSIDSERLLASYNAMMSSDMTDEQRAAIWERCREIFPSMSKAVAEQYDQAVESKDDRQLDRTTGVTFLFLAVVNALTQDPIISLDALPGGFGRLGKNIPTFGYLKKLQ